MYKDLKDRMFVIGCKNVATDGSFDPMAARVGDLANEFENESRVLKGAVLKAEILEWGGDVVGPGDSDRPARTARTTTGPLDAFPGGHGCAGPGRATAPPAPRR